MIPQQKDGLGSFRFPLCGDFCSGKKRESVTFPPPHPKTNAAKKSAESCRSLETCTPHQKPQEDTNGKMG